MGQMRRTTGAACLVAALGLSGCMSGTGGEGGFVSRFAATGSDTAPEVAADPAAVPGDETARSEIIAALLERRSALEPQSPYGRVARSVLAAGARPAEAELRAARLRAEAQSRNWLPSIGPSLSLTSMGDFVAQLIVEQVLFDNGRKKAERAFAAADVEVAAVTLSEDVNTRVHDALSLYLAAEEARAVARSSEAALKDMAHFEYIMGERVRGGVSDRSDLDVLRQKLAELRATLSAAQEAEATALAELDAMSAAPLGDLRGLGELSLPGGAEPLSVLKAEAEQSRAVAAAKVERATHLPSLKAGGTLGDDGSGIGLSVQSDKLFGVGTGASLQAIEAAEDAAAQRVAQAREDARRDLGALSRSYDAQARQAAEAESLARTSKANLDRFQAQYKAGQRQVMDVVGVYETFHAQERTAIQLRYEAARTRLGQARLLGLLADGSLI